MTDNTKNKLLKTLSGISRILNSNLDPGGTLELILEELGFILNYDKASIMFIEGDGLVIKASRNLNNVFNKKTGVSRLSSLLKKLYNNPKAYYDNNADILDTNLKAVKKQTDSSIIIPLMLRDTMFGVIILVKNKENYFSNEDLVVIETFASAAAYAVKDAELGSVFKMQLKILKENITERAEAVEKIKEQNQKILEADRLKNEFLSNILLN